LNSVNLFIPRADAVQILEGNIKRALKGKHKSNVWKLQAREPGDPLGLLEEVASSGQRTPPEAMLA
jgi:hypothetical protein